METPWQVDALRLLLFHLAHPHAPRPTTPSPQAKQQEPPRPGGGGRRALARRRLAAGRFHRRCGPCGLRFTYAPPVPPGHEIEGSGGGRRRQLGEALGAGAGAAARGADAAAALLPMCQGRGHARGPRAQGPQARQGGGGVEPTQRPFPQRLWLQRRCGRVAACHARVCSVSQACWVCGVLSAGAEGAGAAGAPQVR
jgi:hypothetical protein